MRISNPLKNQKEMISARRWGFFEHDPNLFDDLRAYDWIENYQRTLAIRAEINDLTDLLRETRNARPSKPELLDAAKKWFSDYQDRRIKIIQAAVLNADTTGRNPFSVLMQNGALNCLGVGTQKFFGSLTWVEIESSIKRLDESTLMTKKEREQAIKHAEKKLNVLKAELENLFPKNHNRFRRSGAKGSDIRAELIDLWVKVQKQCDAAVDPTGRALKYSTPQEQAAHKKLGIDAFVDPLAKFRPYDFYQKEN